MTQTPEALYAELLRGGSDNSPLATDGYKFSMAQAGFPLREEVFYLHFRKGGPLFIPFDFEAVIQELRPRLPTSAENSFLQTHGYGLTHAMERALLGDLEVYTQPKDTWAMANEPVLTLKGPSFLVSWFEALVIAFHFPMQVATAIYKGARTFYASCEDERAIIHLVADQLGISVEVNLGEDGLETYPLEILGRIDTLREAVDLDRVFEVGTRAMSCMQQHWKALQVCKEQGIHRTANVQLAYDLYMIPVGTTGHEHQERHGRDVDGFRAVRDQRPEPPSYLFDTYDPMNEGIPSAIKVIAEDPKRPCSMRFDSGDQESQLARILRLLKGVKGAQMPMFLFMDGYNASRVREMEEFCTKTLSVPVEASRRHYGLGSYLVSSSENRYTRDCVAMVYKLCQSGSKPVKKYSGTPGKESLAGDPQLVFDAEGNRIIAQKSESTFYSQHPHYLRDYLPEEAASLSERTQKIQIRCKIRDKGQI